MFYSLNASLPPFFICIDIITIEVRKLSDVWGPQVEKLLILSNGFFINVKTKKQLSG